MIAAIGLHRLTGAPLPECSNFLHGRQDRVSPKYRGDLETYAALSQRDLVIEHLARGWTLTQAECTHLYNCTRLAARVPEANAMANRKALLWRIVNIREGRGVIGNYAEYKMEESK